MTASEHEIAETLIGKDYDAMDAHTQRVARHLTERRHVSRNTADESDGSMTTAQRAADAVARFGGSWTFIFVFALVLIAWVVLNSVILLKYDRAFDPYPYILLNLFLSMLASIQAPIILMSQNRQAEIDRKHAEHDYEVNLKAELEILLLHEKMDGLREQQWQELIDLQQQQIGLLEQLLAEQNKKPS
ncbi:DUF1003 domain-containing protein [Methylophilus glucosoxydans]|jgi:uncharacterized membrane protein|uniref:DUF1003 domain-containing protein n=1 Tax=Methylophilus glucosoxydans TaxID=752553 RepID=A0ABW3GML2_9PROT|nr:DUF1003 domain-containing protein [Methylophilus sp. VKM B-3414]MDT7850211.1 DUF1003 domain-containing protein [Methylophilus sp. VKM B-3414]BEV08420.1 DUF1003 domain-containing protein [Methylophilus sp. DW102]